MPESFMSEDEINRILNAQDNLAEVGAFAHILDDMKKKGCILIGMKFGKVGYDKSVIMPSQLTAEMIAKGSMPTSSFIDAMGMRGPLKNVSYREVKVDGPPFSSSSN